MKRWFLLLLIVFPFSFHQAFAFDFSVSPNEDGSADVHFSHQWFYNSFLFSSLNGEYRNSFEEEEGKTDYGTEYSTTVGKTLSLSADVLGIEQRSGILFYSLAANLTYEIMNLRDLGYTDQYNGSVNDTVRFFILNDRNIDLTLPRLTLNTGLTTPYAKLSVGGEYSPWLYVNLNQELTISPGLEKTGFNSSQSAQHAFSVNAKLRFFTPYLQPELFAEYDYLDIKYDVLTAGGEATVDTVNRTLRIRATLIPRFIELQGFFPSISIVYEKDWLDDSATDEIVEDQEYSFQFGFSM